MMINVAWFTSLREVTLMILQVTLWSGQRTFFLKYEQCPHIVEDFYKKHCPEYQNGKAAAI